MKRNELFNLIDSFAGDVQLRYKDEDIFIDPLIRGEKIYVGYKDADMEFKNVDDVFHANIINGKSLNDICEDLEVL